MAGHVERQQRECCRAVARLTPGGHTAAPPVSPCRCRLKRKEQRNGFRQSRCDRSTILAGARFQPRYCTWIRCQPTHPSPAFLAGGRHPAQRLRAGDTVETKRAAQRFSAISVFARRAVSGKGPFRWRGTGALGMYGRGSRGPTRHVCSICSVVRKRDRVAGAGYACNARPDRSPHRLPLIS
jgi:hypothetical protein